MPRTTEKTRFSKAEPAKAEEAELPEWLTETPFDTGYALCMDQGGEDPQECQRVRMTRTEFLLCKLYLAKLRGIDVPVEPPGGLKTTAQRCTHCRVNWNPKKSSPFRKSPMPESRNLLTVLDDNGDEVSIAIAEHQAKS